MNHFIRTVIAYKLAELGVGLAATAAFLLIVLLVIILRNRK